MLQRVKEVQESDLRMVGALARNIQRVIAVTQADIDAAAAQGRAWIVKPVVKVSDPLDNLRGGTQLVIKQNTILPGQNVMRVMYIGGQAVVVGPGTSPLSLPDATDNDILSLIAFGGTEQRNLPDGYIERQFVYMMEGSYLLTDLVPTYDCKIEMDFQTTSVPSGSVYLLGGRTETYGGLFFAKGGGGVCLIDAFGTTSDDRYTSSVSLSSNTRYKFTFDNKVVTLESGGTTLFTNTFTGENANGAALVINGLNANGTVVAGQAGIYLYSFKVWNAQGELVMDLVPAVQKGTVPVVGFYDTVSKTFKTATSGTFAAGGEAVPTPDAPMDIVCNNGVLKYVDTELPTGYRRITGMSMSNNCYYQITDFRLTSADTVKASFEFDGTACNVLGSYTTSSAQDNLSLYVGTSSTSKYLRYNGGTYSSYCQANTRYDIQITPTGSLGFETNSTWTQKTFTCPVDFLIGSTSVSATSNKFGGSFYGNVEVVDRAKFIPCERVSDGEIGWYDIVSNTFYEPTGTTPTSLGYDYSHYAVIADGTVETIAIKDDQSATVSTATCEDLLSVGDYTDEQEIIGGTVTRKVGVKVLDGTENWAASGTSGTDNYRFILDFSAPSTNNVTALCTHIDRIIQSNTVSQSDRPCIRFSLSGGSIAWYEQDNTTTLAQFTQWLADQYAAGTPVIIVYPLATPTTESVTGQPMQTAAGDNTAEITQAGMAGLELEVEYIKQ